jgi:hypothetical protein
VTLRRFQLERSNAGFSHWQRGSSRMRAAMLPSLTSGSGRRSWSCVPDSGLSELNKPLENEDSKLQFDVADRAQRHGPLSAHELSKALGDDSDRSLARCHNETDTPPRSTGSTPLTSPLSTSTVAPRPLKLTKTRT